MGQRANHCDNAKAESFMKPLKVEEVYLMECDKVRGLQRQAAPFGARISEPLRFEEEQARQIVKIRS